MEIKPFYKVTLLWAAATYFLRFCRFRCRIYIPSYIYVCIATEGEISDRKTSAMVEAGILAAIAIVFAIISSMCRSSAALSIFYGPCLSLSAVCATDCAGAL